MEVGEWLKGLGLGQYEATFRDHDIGADVLADLSEVDLEKIGLPLGARKRLMKAIASLAPAATPVLPRDPRVAARGGEEFAERRPITVMFCDLVGSTALAAKLDAEDWRSLVNAYLDEASRAVTGLGGHVLKKLGDGLMALFGYPHAQENDAERAVRAALAIQRALAELNAKNSPQGLPALAARIGLESGPVVVDRSGEVFGEAPNIAARVQSLAEPGSVLVTANVQRQTAGLFVAEDRGPHELKGAPAPVTLYRIVRASGGGRRGGARAPTPLVGREEELDLLRRRWERARSGEGQLALIVGEPGIGKSRLVEEFRAYLGETPHTWVEWSSSQLLQNTPLHPFAEWGRHRFGAELPADERLADLEGTLKLVGLDPAEYAPLIAPLVDIPLPVSLAPGLPPEELRRRQLAAIVAWVLAGARSQAVAIAIEDLHWADPTSLDLLQTLAERGAQAPLFIIATARPEFRPPWSLRSHHSVVSLSPLARAEVTRMVGEIAQRHALSKDVIEDVSERTGGVPLFVEEVTRLLLERGEQGGAHAIPPTLQQSLAARLDRLGEAREIAQIGAVLGRSFSYALLRSVAAVDDRGAVGGVGDPALQSALERLAGADILFVEGAPPQATYRFKHALIQDAAYESLLKSRRQPLHRRAAEVLSETGAEPEAIAHHFTEAGLDELAIEWWGKAGDEALRRSAFQEAIAHLGRAIAMADKAAGGTPQRISQLQVGYGNALIGARGYNAPETTAAFAKARASTAAEADAPERLASDYGLWAGSYTRNELQPMRTHAASFLADVAARPDSPEASVAHRVAGVTHWFAGEYHEAREHLQTALALFQPERDDDLAYRFGQDIGAAAMLYLALVLWPLGDVARAVSLMESAQRRLAVRHVGTHAYIKMHAAMFELMRGDHARAAANAFELAAFVRDYDLPFWRATSEYFVGWAPVESVAAIPNLEAMRRGVELMRTTNTVVFDGLTKGALAEAESRAGDPARALAILDEALATSERTGQRAYEAELHRVRGENLLKRDPSNPAPAEEALRTAIAVARKQETRSFELRAALSLARLYQSTGRPVEARAVLAPALEHWPSLLPSGRRAGDEGTPVSNETAGSLTPDPSPARERGDAASAEMPEIAEARALMAALAETDEVKAAEAQRERRLNLQTAYSEAMMWGKGFAAEETKAALAREAELTEGAHEFSARFAALQNQHRAACTAGELRSARAQLLAFLPEAEDAGRGGEAAAVNNMLGLIAYWQGDFVEARARCERALDACGASLDSKDWGTLSAYASSFLALALWQLGEVERARELTDGATKRADEIGGVQEILDALFYKSYFELWRGDPIATLRTAEALEALAREHGAPQYLNEAELHLGWARGRIDDPIAGAAQMRRVIAAFVEQGVKVNLGFYTGLLAQLEAETLGAESALARIDEAFRLSEQVEHGCSLPFLHRLRGEILLKRDPADPAPAEEAFRTSIAIAKEQGARSPLLQASLSLAKLYQSTARCADAHAVLAPALEHWPSLLPSGRRAGDEGTPVSNETAGSLTPDPSPAWERGEGATAEMPELAEARALLASLDQGHR